MNPSYSSYTTVTALFWLVIYLNLVGPRTAYAQANPNLHPIDLVIVLDDSGSMFKRGGVCEAGNDPSALRYSAARLAVQLLDDNDRVSIIRFGDSVVEMPLNNQTGLVEISANTRDKILQSLSLSDSNLGGTNIAAAFIKALNILSLQGDEQRAQYIIFLTDGKPTAGVNDDTAAQTKLVAEAKTKAGRSLPETFPVYLYNESNCPDTAIPTILKEMNQEVKVARKPSELVRVFGELMAHIKPNLYTLPFNEANRGWNITDFQGVEAINIVTDDKKPRLTLNSGEIKTQQTLQNDPNLQVYATEGKIGAGKWRLQTPNDKDSFVMIRALTYPEVIHPPPSIRNSATATRYVPAGKPQAVLAKVIGPGGADQIVLNSNEILSPLDQEMRWARLSKTDKSIELKIGIDTQPLLIRRIFNFQAISDLPAAKISERIRECAAGTGCALQAGFPEDSGVLASNSSIAYVTDEMLPNSPLRIPLICENQTCRSDPAAFTPAPGKTYNIRFFMQALKGNRLFGDFVEERLTLKPSIVIRSIPIPLDLKDQPENIFQGRVVAGTTKALGYLTAQLSLVNKETKQNVGDQLKFEFQGADITGAGEQPIRIGIVGVNTLPIGNYEGEVKFSLPNPDREISLPQPIPVIYKSLPVAAELTGSDFNFGTIALALDGTASKVEVTRTLEVQFQNEQPFGLRAIVDAGTSYDLAVDSKWEKLSDGKYRTTLTLRINSAVIREGPMTGMFKLEGLSSKTTVEPSTALVWRVNFEAPTFQVLGGVVNGQPSSKITFGDTGFINEAAEAIIRVKYSGKVPPFPNLQITTLDGKSDAGLVLPDFTLQLADFVLETTQEFKPVVGQANTYDVKIKLLPKRNLPWPLPHWDTYNGRISMSPQGLTKPASAEFSFRNPSWFTRNVPWSFPLLFPCFFPLLLGFAGYLYVVNKDNGDSDNNSPEKNSPVLPPPPLETDIPSMDSETGPRPRSKPEARPKRNPSTAQVQQLNPRKQTRK